MPTTIKSKITRIILLATIIPIVAVTTISIIGVFAIRNHTIRESRTALTTEIKNEITILADSRADVIDDRLRKIQDNTHNIAKTAENIAKYPEEYANRSVTYLRDSEILTPAVHLRTSNGVDPLDPIIAAHIALFGNIQDALSHDYMPYNGIGGNYIGTTKGVFITVDTGEKKSVEYDTNYPVTTRPWWITAVDAGKLAWTEMFPDAAGRGVSIACAEPFYYKDGTLAGVASSGTTLHSVAGEVLENTEINGLGYAFLLNEEGKLVITPNEIPQDEKGALIYEDYLFHEESEVRALAEKMVMGDEGIMSLTLDGEEVFVAYAPLVSTNWSVGIVFPISSVNEPVDNISNKIRDNIFLITMIFFLFAVVILCIFIAVSFNFADSFSKPIKAVTESVQIIANGDLDRQIDINTNDELETLGNAVNKMSANIKGYIADLSAVTAEKERIETELSIAAQIQESMLPHIFPPFPDRTEFDIMGVMFAAKEVGGDFYDYYIIDNNLYTVIGDVSGKGVPAAMFMAITKMLIKSQGEQPTNDIFEITNNVLCENNDADMFVTSFIGRLDVTTGEYFCSNAGHDDPIVKRKGGKWEKFSTHHSLVLAGMENMHYKEDPI
ncbi:MAG: SpoIIE family protein phosphatase, partial [Oscillospiraceae bacterium]|nr:SpoIIE family protein phosphatase [Oscillospiraceae bacterium]